MYYPERERPLIRLTISLEVKRSCVYVTEQGSKISVGNGKLVIECKNNLTRQIPIETVESLVLFGNMQITLSAQKELLERGISTSLLSTRGHYYGRLMNTSSVNAERFKRQVYLSDNLEQRLLFAKKTIAAKIHNQAVVAKRYTNNKTNAIIIDKLNQLQLAEKRLASAENLEEVMGIEGSAEKNYFGVLSNVIDKDFSFIGRNRRPPKDPFNAMISLGYTIVFYEIYAELENQNINPYIGFTHTIQPNHPALVSDLLEEWRAVLVDSTVMSMVQGHEIGIDEFTRDEETGGVIISSSGVRKFIGKLEKKMAADMNYLSYLDRSVSFRRGIWWQTKTLAHCIDYEQLKDYLPLRIR